MTAFYPLPRIDIKTFGIVVFAQRAVIPFGDRFQLSFGDDRFRNPFKPFLLDRQKRLRQEKTAVKVGQFRLFRPILDSCLINNGSEFGTAFSQSAPRIKITCEIDRLVGAFKAGSHSFGNSAKTSREEIS